jgi:hypothetical protein
MPLLSGAVVQRVDSAPGVCAIQVRVPGETVYVLLVASREASGLGLVDADARQAAWSGRRLPPGARRSAFARDLEGARVVEVRARSVVVARDDERFELAALAKSVVTRSAGEGDALGEEARAGLFERGAALAGAAARACLDAMRDEALRALDAALARLRRRADAVRGDLARIGEAEGLVATAQWIVAAAARAPRGARSLAYTDWTSGEPVEREVALDPAKSAREQVDAMFKRARRLKQGARFAEARLAQTEGALVAVQRARDAAAGASDGGAVEAALAEAKGAAPRDVRLAAPQAGKGRAAAPRATAAYRTFRSGDARILVGKGAAQNDALTLHVARPWDLWLHAKGRTGAHVVVPLTKGKSCPGEVLVDAAHLAAHFSDARGERIVDVSHVDRRHVRKPKGSPAGAVVVDREKVLALRVEAPRLERLLASEET